MLNHLRNLLLNLDAAANDPASPGGEVVPAGYTQLPLPGFLQTLRATLFGPFPDQLMLNYRVRQLLTLLHTTELAEFVTDLDPRISYATGGLSSLFSSAFGVTVTPLGDTTQTLTILGEPAPADRTGRCRREWLVSVASDSQVTIDSRTAPAASDSVYYFLTSGKSAPLQLPSSDLWFRVTGTVGDSWLIVSNARPQDDLGEVVVALQGIGEPTLDQLFGAGTPKITSEPFQTFANLWYRHPELAYKLGGLVLAMAYRTEEIRLTGAVHA